MSALGDKYALAGILAPYLDGREIALADELADRGKSELAEDEDFLRILGDRVRRCEDCGVWHALSWGEEGSDPYCPECDGSWWSDE